MSKQFHGMDAIEFDLYVSSKYREKAGDAKTRKLAFELTFADFRRILARQRCEYTNINLTLPKMNGGVQQKTDLTIERVNNKLGYVPGNCIAVCSSANSIKGVFEDPNTTLDVSHAIRMFATIDRMNKAQ